ncbi:ABC transporter ATP-binding protein [Candidimonas nitroreducens]|uniref:Iron ABC transporter ATP-binding protein n=1 Tax=Candidimonas nitroreducens TaxID=683354 RepID=A0A225LZ36_9BURK|nr:ABC transporter ATP-binding protein [Candidimonas nitroreducens]OWT54236.1 iron ABC transporter ATP-binding protein [Candidimonas nitroreducens]
MAPTTQTDSLFADGISVRLGGRGILSGLDIPPLPAGALVALLGPNGSGKSTLLKALAGLVPARAARLALGATDLRPMAAAARAHYLRYLPPGLPADVHLSVFEAVMVALRARPGAAPATNAARRVAAVLDELGIAALADRYLDELSDGQRQLAGLAQAMVHEPAVLLLDEPLTALDLNHQHHVMQILLGLAHERRILVVLVLHDLDMALRYADQALLLTHGALLAAGTPAEVIRPDHLARAFSILARVESSSLGHPHVLVSGLADSFHS